MSYSGMLGRGGRKLALAAGALILQLLAGGAAAQEPSTGQGGWEFLVEPYFVAPNMEGTTGVGPVSSDVDADPSDIFDHLQFGAMLYLEAHNPVWAFALDGIYMDLSQDGSTPVGKVEVGMQQGAIVAQAYRRLTPWAELMVGGQINILSASLDGSGPVAVDESSSKTWFDPLIGGRLTVPGHGPWRLSLTGNVGGFGVGSDFAWQLYPSVGYRVSHLIELVLGYRAIGLDYTTGSGNRKFTYDMTIFGPQLGLGFHF